MFRLKFTVLMACAIVLVVVFSALFAWTYTMEYQKRLSYDLPLEHCLDIDGDGLTDAYVVEDHYGHGGQDRYTLITFLRNTGGGHLREEARWKTQRTISDLMDGDMDGDGYMEFIAPAQYSETNSKSIFLLSLKGWELGVQERPGGAFGFCNLTGDGRMQLDGTDSVWQLVNGSLERIPVDGDISGHQIADFDMDGQNEVAAVTDREPVILSFFSYASGRLVAGAKLTMDSIQHWERPWLVRPSGVVVYAGGVYMSDRPALIFDWYSMDIMSSQYRFPGLPNIGESYNGTAVYWDNASGSYVHSNASVLELSHDSSDRTQRSSDLNGDGFPDYALTETDHITVYTSRMEAGLLRYGWQALHITGPGAFYLEDLNGDLKQDIAAIDFGSGIIRLFPNDGAGRFTAGQVILFPPASPRSGNGDSRALGFSDLNGDGHLDMVAANPMSGGSFTVLFGDGACRFSNGGNYRWGVYPANGMSFFDSGQDLNGDGRPDIVFVSGIYNTQRSHILLNDGNGGFPDLMAMPMMLLAALCAATSLTLIYPILRSDRPQWAGLPPSMKLSARARTLPMLLVIVVLFFVWAASGLIPQDAFLMVAFFMIFYLVVLLLPLLAAVGRPSRTRFAGLLLGASWFFLVATLAAGIILPSTILNGGSPGKLLVLSLSYGAVVSVFVLLTVLGIRRMRAMDFTTWPSSPISPELIYYLEGAAVRKYPLSPTARAYLVGQSPPLFLTVVKEKGFWATLAAGTGLILERRDPGPLLAELTRKMEENDRPSAARPPEELSLALSDAKAASNAGRILGRMDHYELPFLAVFLVLIAVSVALLFLQVSTPSAVTSAFSFIVSIFTALSLMLVINYRSSSRVYDNAIDHRGALSYERTWLCDIRRVRPLQRYLFARVGPMYDIAIPSHYAVETSEGKRFHVSGETVLLLKKALGPLWTGVFDDSGFAKIPDMHPGRSWLRTPIRGFGVVLGLVASAFFWLAFFAVIILATIAYSRFAIILFTVPLAATVTGALAIRALMDWHLGRIIAVKAALADSSKREAVEALPNAQALRRAAGNAVVRSLPSAVPSRMMLAGITVARTSLAVGTVLLLILPLLLSEPSPVHRNEQQQQQTSQGPYVFMNVTGTEVLQGKHINASGNIVVSGSLSLVDCTISMGGNFRVNGSLAISGSSISRGKQETVFRCIAADARMMVSLDLSRSRTASLMFSTGHDIPNGTSMELRKDGVLLWNASGKTGWDERSVSLDGFCGRTVVLDLAPVGWQAGASFQLSGLQLQADGISRSILDTKEQLVYHGWDRSEGSGSAGISADGGRIDIRDTRFDIQGSYSGQRIIQLVNSTMSLTGVKIDYHSHVSSLKAVNSTISIANSELANMSMELLNSTMNMSSSSLSTQYSGIQATASRLGIEGCSFDMRYSGLELVNTTGSFRDSKIQAYNPFIITPVAGYPCRLSDSLDIRGNHIFVSPEYSYDSPGSLSPNGMAFRIMSSLPVSDIAEIAGRNRIDFESVCIVYAGLEPMVYDGARNLIECDLYSMADWVVQVMDNSSNVQSTRQQAGEWCYAGHTDLSFDSLSQKYLYTYSKTGFQAGMLRRTFSGLELYSPANSTVRLKADSMKGLGEATVDISAIRAVDHRMPVIMTLADVCDAGVQDVNLGLDAGAGNLTLVYSLTTEGDTGAVAVTLRYNNEVIAGSFGSAYSGQMVLPIKTLARNGTLELSVEPDSSPDIDMSNNNWSMSVETLTGPWNFSGPVKAPQIWVLDNASVTFEGCALSFPGPEAFVFCTGENSSLELSNTTIDFGSLTVQSDIDISVSGCRFAQGNESFQSLFSLSGRNITLSGSDFEPGTEPGYLTCYLFAGNLSIGDCSFSRTSLFGSGLFSMNNASFRDSPEMNLYIGPDCRIKRCLFSNVSIFLSIGDIPGDFTFANNTFSNTTLMYISGPADIDAIASSNTFSDLSNETVIVYRQLELSISSSWLLNLTTSEVLELHLDYSSIGLSNTVYFSENNNGDGKIYLATLYPVVAKFNASGRNVLETLKYTLRIFLTNGEDMSYEGTFALGATGPLEIRLE